MTGPDMRRGGPRQETATPTSSQLPRSVYAGSLDSAIEHAATDWWSRGAALALRQLAMTGRGFNADHLLDLVGQPPDPHFVGAVFAAAHRSGVIEPVGARVGRDGRLVRIWWGVSQ